MATTLQFYDRRRRGRKVENVSDLKVSAEHGDRLEVTLNGRAVLLIFTGEAMEISGNDLYVRQTGVDSLTVKAF